MAYSVGSLEDQVSRNSFLQTGISKKQFGVEIGPFFAPVFPKSQGWSVLSTDAFSREELLERCANNPAICNAIHNIEEVDIVSSGGLYDALAMNAKSVVQLKSGFDYICSSHSFEHLPNPVGFLQDAEKILKPGGLLIMAIPSYSECFDLLRPRSTLGELIDAYLEGRRLPTPGQYIDHVLNYANFTFANNSTAAMSPLGHKVVKSLPNSGRDHCYNTEWFDLVAKQHKDGIYLDAHCWCFSATSFVLLFADLKALGLVSLLELLDIKICGTEFLVRIGKAPQRQVLFKGKEAYSRISLLAEVKKQDLKSLRDISIE